MRFFRRPLTTILLSIFVLLPGRLILAADIPIKVLGTTETQVIIRYTATTAEPCTLTATDNNAGPAVNDLDPVKFPNSNSDLGRTSANGFRWPTIVDGLNRTVFIGGHDEIKQGADTKWYSTALQVNSDHTITVTCNGGADSGIQHAKTVNLPIGSYFPELKIPTPGNPVGGLPQFTVDWSLAGRAAKYVDPITGVLIERVTGPTDNFDDTNPVGETFFSHVVDINGAWTNPGSAIANANPPTQYAQTSTPNAPLLVPFGTPISAGGDDLTDLQVSLFGSGSGGAQAELCITEDGGQTCASGVIDQAFSSSTGAQANVPVAFPSPYFTAWGGGFANAPFLLYDLGNFTYPAASASGSTVSLANTSTVPGFNLDRKPGSPFYLYNCSGGGSAVLHVSHTDRQYSLVAQETGLSLSNCTYQDLAAGIRIILKNSGTLKLSQFAAFAAARSPGSGSNGTRWMCARSKVTDISTDCDGANHNPGLSGSLCFVGGLGIYLLQDNGRICLQSNGYGPAHLGSLPDPYGSGSPWIDNKSLLGVDYSANMWKLVHKPNNYQEYNGGYPHTNVNDNFTWTNQTTGTTPIASQITAQFPNSEVAKALNSGLWGNASVDNILDTPGFGSGAVIQYRWTAPGSYGDGLCMMAWADAATNNLVSIFSTWNGPKGAAAAACHFTPVGFGGYAYVAFAGNANYSLAPIKFNNTTVLGGPFISRGIGLHRSDGSFANWSLPSITAATNASPVVLTSIGHDIDNVPHLNNTQGVLVNCSGGTGAWAGLNGTFYAHFIDDNTFSLYSDAIGAHAVDSSPWGAFSGQSILCTTMSPVYALVVASVSNNAGSARITANLTANGISTYFPSGKTPMRDGDPISFGSLSYTKQYYGKKSCTGCAANQFDVYLDAALSNPAPYASLSTVAQNTFVLYAETCPDPSTVDTSWIFADTGIGSPGSPVVRCITVRLNSEPCSDFASSNEQKTWPCPSDTGNTSRSSLHNVNVGDAFFDLSHAGNNHEYFGVLTKTKASESQIDFTLIRDFASLPGGICRNGGNDCRGDPWAQNHSPGWSFWQTASIDQGFVPAVTAGSTPAVIPSYLGAGHVDIGLGKTLGNLSFAGSYGVGSPDPVVNVPPTTLFTTPDPITTNNYPVWARDTTHPYTALQQAYSTLRQVPGVAPDSELVWNGNWAAMNGEYGNAGNNGDGGWGNRTLSLQSGTSYVYKIPPMGSIAVKLFPALVFNGEHGYFTDKSGPGSLITDADLGKFCIAHVARECRPGSNAGDVFAAMRLGYDNGQCLSNSGTLGTACAIVLGPVGGWAIQQRLVPPTYDGSGIRRLTLGVSTIPTQHYTFRYWLPTPDAKWGLFSDNPVGGHPAFGAGTSAHWWAMKLPPWPGDDSKTVERMRYSHTTKVHVGGGASGDQVRIAFGYGENGDPTANLYCMTRMETCWTSSAATDANPFVFDSEPQQKTACTNGCDVNIPAIAGRIVFYRVERSNGTSATMGPLTAIPVP